MRECDYYQELISRLTDGEINGFEHSALTSHMETCCECRNMYYVFSQLSQIIEGEDEYLPDGLHENIMSGIRLNAEKKKKSPRLKRQTRSFLAAAACFAVLVFAASGIVSQLSRSSALRSEAAVSYDAASGVPSEVTITSANYAAIGTANAAIYAHASSVAEPSVVNDTYSDAYVPDVYSSEAAAVTPDPYGGDGLNATTPAPSPAATAEAVAVPEVKSVIPAEAPAAPEVSAAETTPEVTESAVANASIPQATVVVEVPETPVPSSGGIGTMIKSAFGISSAEEALDPAFISEEITVTLSGENVWKDLSVLLLGEDKEPALSELPSETAGKVYTIVVPSASGEARVYVYEYEDALYYTTPDALGTAGIYRGGCTVDEYTDFINEFPFSNP